MTPEQEKQYREDLRKSNPVGECGPMSKMEAIEWAYIEARKKSQEVISEIEKRYEKMIDDYHSRLIASLKKAKERDELIKECLPWLKEECEERKIIDHANGVIIGEYQQKLSSWIEKARKLVAEK